MPNWLSFCVLNTVSSVVWMLELDMLGSKISTFGPKFGVFDCAGQPVPPPPPPVVNTLNSHSE